jgi:peptidoglycan/xylan/chitin deacetylase (PgdA/CDA1 family)
MVTGQSTGILVVSLDFELYWGVRDKRSIPQYEENLRGVHRAVEAMLSAFSEHGVHATWATVGFLLFRNAAELKRSLPSIRPTYADPELSPYRYIDEHDLLEESFHFAPDIIELIRHRPGQEIATHTFSHYYCLQVGQDLAAFREDIAAAVRTASSRGISLHSMAFPRNQWSQEYVNVLGEFGIRCFRGNEDSLCYRPMANEDRRRPFMRALRLIDAYVNLTGHHTYSLDRCLARSPFSIPSSRFLRPYSSRLAVLDPLRLARITRAMSDAAVNRRVFHLWWHPEDFGANTDQNIAFLRKILDHFTDLRARYGMESVNMGELSNRLVQMDGSRT